MPKIPELTPQVQTAALPAARFTARADADDFGAGLGRGVSQVAQVAGEIAQEEKQKADALAVMDADRRLSELETQLLYDADNGALNVRGKDALSLPDTVLPDLDEQIGQIRASLSGDEQKLAFTRMANARRDDINRTLQRHVSSEYEAYDKQATDAALANSLEAAANNYQSPERVATELTRQRAYILSRAERTGMADEAVQLQIEAMTSQTHQAVLDRMLANGDYQGAKEYYKANGEDIAGTDRDEIEEAIQTGELRGKAQTETDAILASNDNRADALKAARGIEDPEVRDSVVERVNKRFTEQKVAEDERRNEILQNATDLISNGGSVDDIPPQQWTQLDQEQRSNLRALAARGEWYQDDKRWYDFVRKIQEDPKAVANMNLFAEVRPYVDDAHWNEALRLQQAAKDSLKGDPTNLNNELSFEQRFNDSLLESGLFDTTSGLKGGDAQRYARLRTQAAEAVEQESAAKGRKLTGQEIKQVVDRVTSRTVFEKGFFFDSEVPAGTIETDDVGDTFVPLDRIPDAELVVMQKLAERFGTRLTNDRAQRAYAAYLIGDKEAFDTILSGGEL